MKSGLLKGPDSAQKPSKRANILKKTADFRGRCLPVRASIYDCKRMIIDILYNIVRQTCGKENVRFRGGYGGYGYKLVAFPTSLGQRKVVNRVRKGAILASNAIVASIARILFSLEPMMRQ